MKIAYLIIAHHQPSHIAKLIKLLSSNRAYFFIHIDKKSRISCFKKLIQESDHIVFLSEEERVNVQWGGFSQIVATLRLMEKALNSKLYISRFCLLSGSDYPIKKLDYIEMQLSTNKEFIRIDNKLTECYDDIINRSVMYYWFPDNYILTKARLSGKIRRRIYHKIELYKGSQWWSLTGQCVKYITEFLKQNRDYLNFHKYTVCSDEIFFHSIVKSSQFAKNITHDMVNPQRNLGYSNSDIESNEHGCHYIDWSDLRSASPKVLDINDFSRIMSSEALFARKFDEEKSKELIKLLEAEISSEFYLDNLYD